jgi:hypothetical protein
LAISSAVVLLRFVPPRTVSQRQPPVLPTIIREGVPIVVWPRNAAAAGATLEEVYRLLTEPGDLACLPLRVHAQRQAAGLDAAQQKVLRSLAVLVDDPERLPPDVPGSRWHQALAAPH